MVIILAFMHLLVDAVCAATVMSSRSIVTPEERVVWILFYNTMAFSTQPVFGYIADRVKRSERLKGLFQGHSQKGSAYIGFSVLGAVLVSAGAVFHAIPPISVSLVGIGNSIFHVGGGGYSLSDSAGKATKVGVFVGPGAIGLALGLAFPERLGIFKVALAIFAFLTLIFFRAFPKNLMKGPVAAPVRNGQEVPDVLKHEDSRPEMSGFSWIAVALAICAAVAFRAFGGAFPSFPWKVGTFAIFASVGFVVAGKMLGGVIHDRIGALPTLIVSFVASTILLTFFPEHAVTGTAGFFFLNIAMPVTVYLLYRSNTKFPGFTFGLSAAALYPGTLAAAAILSGTLSIGEVGAKAIFASMSVFALICVYLAYKMINRHEKRGSSR